MLNAIDKEQKLITIYPQLLQDKKCMKPDFAQYYSFVPGIHMIHNIVEYCFMQGIHDTYSIDVWY